MRILIVEDARRLAEAVAEILRKQGYAVDIAHDGVEGADALAEGDYDAALLDIMLPRRDGLVVLSDMRAMGDTTPVILLTARGDVSDRVRGLDAGADDYLSKPFHAEELLARIRAVTRRPPNLDVDGKVRALGLTLSPDTMTLAGETAAVKLSVKECQLMEVLLHRAGRVVGKGDIIGKLWGAAARSGENRAEVLVHVLRGKLAALDAGAEIATVRGVGYILQERKGDDDAPAAR